MKKILLIIFILLSLFSSISSWASSSENSVRVDARYGHFHLGFGEAYSPVDYRVGSRDWEVGIFHGRILGGVSLYELSPHFYFAIGAGLYLGEKLSFRTLSIYSAVGADFWKLWLLNFRSEIGMYTNAANYTGGKIMLGLSLGF